MILRDSIRSAIDNRKESSCYAEEKLGVKLVLGVWALVLIAVISWTAWPGQTLAAYLYAVETPPIRFALLLLLLAISVVFVASIFKMLAKGCWKTATITFFLVP